MRHAGLALFLFLAGCTHEQLAASTARTAATVMEIQYQVVLDNLARMQGNPAALPSHIRIKQGTVQVSDELGLYQLEASGAASGTFGGPRAERTVSEQWGADAISDPLAVKQLQDIYRAALRLPPLDDPGFLQPEPQAAKVARQAGKAGPLQAMRRIDLRRDVPQGWFHAGIRAQVPGNAVHVAHAGNTWVWVSPDGLAGLSRFTLLVLFVTKLGPGEGENGGAGLIYTGGGK